VAFTSCSATKIPFFQRLQRQLQCFVFHDSIPLI
jgi:hypothetical protein